MRSTTVSGEEVWLIDDEPNWSGNFDAKLFKLASTTRSLGNRESRRGFSNSIRHTLDYDIVCAGEAARALAANVRSIVDQPVLVPLWPAEVPWSERADRAIPCGLNLVFKSDWSSWSVYATSGTPSYTPAATDRLVPILWGHLDKIKLDWESPDVVKLQIVFTEGGPDQFAVAPSTTSWDEGPLPSESWDSSPVVFPFPVDARDVKSECVIKVITDKIGFGREIHRAIYQTRPSRTQQTVHLLVSADEIGTLYSWCMTYLAGGAFWMPSWTSAVVLTEDVADTDSTISVEDTSGVEVGDWLCFSDPSCEEYAWAQVDSIGTEEINLVSPVGHAFSAGYSVVSLLQLAVHAEPDLRLRWRTPGIAEMSMMVREVPEESDPASDETLGETIGALPTRCYLYTFTRSIAGVDTVTRYTSFEADLTYGGNTYTASKIEHGAIKKGLNLDRDSVEVSVAVDSPLHPLAGIAAQRVLSLVEVAIMEGDVVGTTAVNVTNLITGDVATVTAKGSVIKAKVQSGSGMFDSHMPRVRLQPGCNHSLYDSGCGILKADWEWEAEVKTPGSGGYPHAFGLRYLEWYDTIYAGFFAGGWVEFGSGSTWMRLPILDNTALVTHELTIWTTRDPEPFPEVGDEVLLYPGCDGTYNACREYHWLWNPTGKFNNYSHFGGFPFIPPGNPAAVKRSAPSAGGKK